MDSYCAPYAILVISFTSLFYLNLCLMKVNTSIMPQSTQGLLKKKNPSGASQEICQIFVLWYKRGKMLILNSLAVSTCRYYPRILFLKKMDLMLLAIIEMAAHIVIVLCRENISIAANSWKRVKTFEFQKLFILKAVKKKWNSDFRVRNLQSFSFL